MGFVGVNNANIVDAAWSHWRGRYDDGVCKKNMS